VIFEALGLSSRAVGQTVIVNIEIIFWGDLDFDSGIYSTSLTLRKRPEKAASKYHLKHKFVKVH